MSTRSETARHATAGGEPSPGTIVRHFLDAVDRWGEKEALRRKRDGVWSGISYADLAADVRRLADALRTLGVERGTRVAILSENRPEWALADYAMLCAGAVSVPVYPNLPASQIVHLLADSGARLIFVSSRAQLDKVREIRGSAPELRHVVVFDEVSVEDREVLTLSQVLELGGSAGAVEDLATFRARALEAVGPEDVATIIYTSGTTGRPKGVMLTHANLHANVRQCQGVLPFSQEDVALSFLPLSHSFERTVDYVLFGVGCAVAYAESFERVDANLLEVKPTIVASVPRLYEKVYTVVLSQKGVRRRIVEWARDVALRWADARTSGASVSAGLRLRHRLADAAVYRRVREGVGGRIRVFVSGGAPLEPDLGRFFYAAGMPILEGYGLTETSPVTNVNTLEALRFGTVGRPVPWTEERIAEDGEVLVRGPQVMKGYLGLPEATREVIDGEGWFHTGDIGTIDGDGFLAITDRKKDLIVTAGGKNIAPQPIENRVKTSTFVTEAVVLGDRRPFPILLVVPNFPVLETWAREAGVPAAERPALLRDARVQRKMEEEAFRRLDEFAHYERPKKIALLEHPFTVDSGELTPSLKVRRRVVSERYAKLIEALYHVARSDDVAAESELES